MPRGTAMLPITSRVTCVCGPPGVYRLYYQSRWVRGAVTAEENDTLYVPHLLTKSGPVVASLGGAAHCLER
jgi:hypothetical protein